jgi:transmembrane sensor
VSDLFTTAELDLLDRYLAGQCTAGELDQVRSVLARLPDAPEQFELLRRAVGHDIPPHPDLRAMWGRLQATVDLNGADARESAVVPLHVPPRHVRISRPVRGWPRTVRSAIPFALAAVLVVGLGIVAGSWYSFRQMRGGALAMRELVTGPGQRMVVELKDGTTVTIAPRTRLRVSATFGVSDRNVTLDGEAFFDIAHQSREPFVIRTRNAVTRVLGTRLNLRAYDSTTTVAVVDGKISLAREDATASSGLIVPAGYVGTLEPNGEAQLRRGDLERYIGWVQGRLVFRETPLPDVLDDIGRRFDVRVSVDDPLLLRQRLTADWPDRSLERVLESLALVLHVHVAREGGEIVLYRK